MGAMSLEVKANSVTAAKQLQANPRALSKIRPGKGAND